MRAFLPLLSFFQLSSQGTFFKFLFLFFRCHINSKDVSPSHMGVETEPYRLFLPKTSPLSSEGHETNSALQGKLHT